MLHNLDTYDLKSYLKEHRTPIDGRTWKRKALVKRVKEIEPAMPLVWGIFSYLSRKDYNKFTNQLNNKN